MREVKQRFRAMPRSAVAVFIFLPLLLCQDATIPERLAIDLIDIFTGAERESPIPNNINRNFQAEAPQQSPMANLTKHVLEMIIPRTTTAIPFPAFQNGIFNFGQPLQNQVQFGEGKLDRFVLREGPTAGKQDFLSTLIGGPWRERGLQWADNGNIVIVDRAGNRFLGSELAVHDKSIEIPFKQWLNFAGNVMNIA